MIEISPEIVTVIMFSGLLIVMLTGVYVAIPMGATAMIVGILLLGLPALDIIYAQFLNLITSYNLLAVPLFIFMGDMLERSGLAEKLYNAFYVWLGGVKGGLALVTVVVGTVLATCVGVVSASVIMLTLVALPSMVKRGYDKSLAAGTTAASGCLGIFIPPSIMLIVYAEMASVSAGKLFMGAFMPGFLLAGLYISYIIIRCILEPKIAPAAPAEQRVIPLEKKIGMLFSSILPAVFLFFAVLGVIFFGIAAPTEAAAVGSVAATVLAISYRRFSWKVLYETAKSTMVVTAMALFVGGFAVAFVGIFFVGGGGGVITDILTSTPGGHWGLFAVIMLAYFILGFFLEWIAIFFIIVPLTSSILPTIGFDPVWFGIMICLNLQASFMTPPVATAIWYVSGTAAPELGVTMAHVIRGVIPFVVIVLVALLMCVAFPEIITWLPQQMIR